MYCLFVTHLYCNVFITCLQIPNSKLWDIHIEASILVLSSRWYELWYWLLLRDIQNLEFHYTSDWVVMAEVQGLENAKRHTEGAWSNCPSQSWSTVFLSLKERSSSLTLIDDWLSRDCSNNWPTWMVSLQLNIWAWSTYYKMRKIWTSCIMMIKWQDNSIASCSWWPQKNAR